MPNDTLFRIPDALYGALVTFVAGALYIHLVLTPAWEAREALAAEQGRNAVIECLYRGEQPTYNGCIK